MTREERVDWLCRLRCWVVAPPLMTAEQKSKFIEALTDTIEALQTEPCEDAISRETVASEFADWFGYNYQNQIFYKRIKSMPSVTAERKGKWIFVHPLQEDDGGDYMCSECKCGHPYISPNWKYCPNCGAKMEAE